MIHISLGWFSDMCIPTASGIIFHLLSRLIPVFNLAVLIVVFTMISTVFPLAREEKAGGTHISALVQ